MALVEIFQLVKENKFKEFQEKITKNKTLINDYLYGATLLFYCIESNKETFALDLLNYEETDVHLKSNVDVSCLEKAMENKLYAIAENLLKRYSKKDIDKCLDYDGETLLTTSIKHYDECCTLILIEANVDVNKPNHKNEYPIELVVKLNQVKTLERMLKTDNFFTGTLPNGFCPILFAAQNDLTEIGILLANGHTDLNVWDSDQKWTPLMHSISNKNELLTVQLIDRNCDVNLVNSDGNTALHIATEIENDDIVKKLLKAEADRNILNDDDMTPLDIARANEDEIIAALLQKI